MLSRKDPTHKYIRIKKKQTQKKCDNIIFIIIYNAIKLHNESNSSNIMCGKYLITTWQKMACPNIFYRLHVLVY